MKKHRKLKIEERRRRRGSLAVVSVAAVLASWGIGSPAQGATWLDEVTLSNGGTDIAEADCSATLNSCIGTGVLGCNITKLYDDAARYHLKWRLRVKDGVTENIRFVPDETDSTGWKNLFVHSGTYLAEESDLDTFPVSTVANGSKTYYTLGSNEFYTHMKWKLCDDGTAGGGGVCQLDTEEVSHKC